MNRRDVLSSLAAWATAASAASASVQPGPEPLPTTVEGWPTKSLPRSEYDFQVDRRSTYKRPDGTICTETLPIDFKIHTLQHEKALLVFRLTCPAPQDRVDVMADNLRSWSKNAGLECPVILLPYGLELDVHRIPADTSSPGVSGSPKE